MKIPETSANGPYYGSNENGQWQGVMADAGVSGVVGSGDGYHQHPPAYVGPQPGYMVGPPYYGPPNNYNPQPQQPTTGQPDDFADYMWMENEEEFDKQVMQQLEEEALMEQCIEAMLEDERERERGGNVVTNGHNVITNNGLTGLSLEEQVSKSTLNPLAAEFIPTFARPQPIDERKEVTPTVSDEVICSPKENVSQTEVIIPPPVIPPTVIPPPLMPPSVMPPPVIPPPVIPPPVIHPEVSAMGILPLDDTEIRQKESNISIVSSPEIKTIPIIEKSKKPPMESKSESRIVKQTKFEEKVDKEVIVVPLAAPVFETVKIEPQPSDEFQPPKPINYAAAAKSKVKKPIVAPAPVEKVTPKPVDKIQQKPTKTVRKNSNK